MKEIYLSKLDEDLKSLLSIDCYQCEYEVPRYHEKLMPNIFKSVKRLDIYEGVYVLNVLPHFGLGNVLSCVLGWDGSELEIISLLPSSLFISSKFEREVGYDNLTFLEKYLKRRSLKVAYFSREVPQYYINTDYLGENGEYVLKRFRIDFEDVTCVTEYRLYFTNVLKHVNCDRCYQDGDR